VFVRLFRMVNVQHAERSKKTESEYISLFVTHTHNLYSKVLCKKSCHTKYNPCYKKSVSSINIILLFFITKFQ